MACSRSLMSIVSFLLTDLLLFQLKSLPIVAENVQDIVLFAGQSNAIGWSDQAGIQWAATANGDAGTTGTRGTYSGAGQSLATLAPVLTRTISDDAERAQRRTDLVSVILRAEESELDRAENEADLLLEMTKTHPNIWSSIWYDVPDAYCSFLLAMEGYSIQPSTPARIGRTSLCGNPWGAELMIGKTVTTLENFMVQKIAQGGSAIHEWRPNDGTYWDKYSRSIANIRTVHPDCENGGCRYRAFVWFHGTTNARSDDPDIGTNYTSELHNLVRATRQIMHTSAGSSPFYATAEDIPVIIVQVGAFAKRGRYGMDVALSQAAFCAFDARCTLVPTDDLSSFYHYDAASQLIIGYRIARALDQLLLLSSKFDSTLNGTDHSPSTRRKLHLRDQALQPAKKQPGGLRGAL